jgi:aldose sugar dehydrogenase
VLTGPVIRRLLVFAVASFPLLAPSGATAAIVATKVSGTLEYPAAFTFLPDGRVLYGELKGGEVRILDPATKTTRLFYTVPNVETSGGEQGIIGIARHPDYPSPRYVYVNVTRTVDGATENHVVRIRNVGGTGQEATTIFRTPAAAFHNGGHIGFGPDKKLYVTVGDNGDPAKSQDMGTRAGKYLRINPNGTIPASNPVAGSPIIATGIRNSFGFGFDPQTGNLWDAQNGPQCNDELNLVPRLSLTNFGWGPSWTCTTPPEAPLNTNQDGTNPRLPAYYWPTPVAPTGAAFCAACSLGSASEGKLFVGQFNDSRLRRFSLNAARDRITTSSAVYTAPGKILAVERAPNGRLYFSTSAAIYRLGLG